MDNTQLENRIRLLENRVVELENWKRERLLQQITFPLDERSIEILKEYFMHITTVIEYDAGAGSNHFRVFLGKQGTKNIVKSSYPNAQLGKEVEFGISDVPFVGYTVNVTTNYLTTYQYSGNLKFFDDVAVTLATEGTAPDPLDAVTGTTYYVINSDGYTFQLSATLGGSAINITTAGTGRQFILTA